MDRVYIIESPNGQDLFEGRREGEALFNALKLAGTDVMYKLSTNTDTFRQGLLFVIDDFYEKSGKFSAMPFIHISAHGDEHGVALTTGDRFTWKEFEECLNEINNKIGHVPLFGAKFSKRPEKISRVMLCLSTCKGYNAYRIYSGDGLCPFQCIVGPTKNISWPDSLTAFIAFYHNANFKGKSITQSVEIMNTSAGIKDVFDLYVSPEINTRDNHL